MAIPLLERALEQERTFPSFLLREVAEQRHRSPSEFHFTPPLSAFLRNSANNEPSWFPVRVGIFEHCPKMREAVWLFWYYVHKTTREEDTPGLGKVGHVMGGAPCPDKDPAKVLGRPERTIRTWRGALVKLGYIRQKRTPFGYVIAVLKSKKWLKGPEKSFLSGRKEPSIRPEATVTQTGSNCHSDRKEPSLHIEEKVDEKVDEKETRKYSSSFDEFWKAYPRKVGKGGARKAWAKIKPDAELQKKILHAIEDQKETDQWAEPGGQYIPHPLTWLNQMRWEDEV